jgi:hypothetical protein
MNVIGRKRIRFLDLTNTLLEVETTKQFSAQMTASAMNALLLP